MSNVHRLHAPPPVKLTKGRKPNSAYRSREHLTEPEIDRLLDAAASTQNPSQSRLLVLLAFRHGLRISETCDVRIDDIDLRAATIYVRRAKNGMPGVHGLEGDELRLIRDVMAQHPHSPFLFLSRRGTPLSIPAVQRFIERLGVSAGIKFPVHFHQIRHSTGFALAARSVPTRDLQIFLGHKNISNTVIYTAVADHRIRTIWRTKRK